MRSVRIRYRWVMALVCLSGFLAISTLVVLRLTSNFDGSLLSWFQSMASFPLDLFSSLVTVTGRAEITGGLALLLAFVWTRREGWSGLAPLVLFVAVAIEAGLKYLVPHEPPPASVLRDFNFLQLVRSEAPYAFPSGHVVRVVLLSVLIGERVAWATPLLASYVVIMCVTRVYVGAHWPSDVIGGLLFGAFAAVVATPAATGAGRALATLRK